MKHIYLFMASLGILLFQSDVFGQVTEEYTNLIATHQVVESAVFTVHDDKFNSSYCTKIDSTYSVDDYVYAELDEDTTIGFMWPFTYKIALQIDDTDISKTVTTYTTCLTLHYDTLTGKPINYSTFYHFTGGHGFKVTVLGITYYDNYENTWAEATVPPGFQVRGLMKIARDYNFDCDDTLTPMMEDNDTVAKLLTLSWCPITGATQYDLEWTFYDDSSQVGKLVEHAETTGYSITSPSYYINNATRVTIDGTSFTIPFNYPPGYIFTRIRPVKRIRNGQLINGKWQYHMNIGDGRAAGNMHFTGLQNSLNWQASSAFAEEGNFKASVNYFDGSLRNRQAVTVSNAEQLAIIGETYYDFNGRPVVKSLPVPSPAQDELYTFHRNFNMGFNSNPFNWLDFDTLGCGKQPLPMDSSSGAAEYYSGNSPFVSADTINSGWFTPNAFGYPYTQTEYTNDNTGRISRQSGAGKDFILGSGHETTYAYGKPSQWELDRLFGNEAGDSFHYLKNLVIDPDTQISVSYIDAHGRVVATALAGNDPSHLQPVGDYADTMMVTESILNNPPPPDSMSSTLTSVYTLLTENSGNYFFSYSLYPNAYKLPDCHDTTICYDCLYTLKITITGDCYSYTRVDSNYTLPWHEDAACAGPASMRDTFTRYLDAGQSYIITKTLSVYSPAIDSEANEFLQRDTCKRSYQSFLDSALAATNFNGCNMTCTTCIEALGTKISFINKYTAQIVQDTLIADTAGTYRTADSLFSVDSANCAAMCNNDDVCAEAYEEMLGDVSPGGQYALYSEDTLGNVTTTDGTSIFATISATDQNYKYMAPATPYLDDQGLPAMINIGGVNLSPGALTPAQFINDFKPSWAKSLVPLYHPEYCFYEWCEENESSNRYDEDMLNTNTYAAAQDSGFLNPLGIGYDTSVNKIRRKDPFFQSGGKGSTLLSQAQLKMEKYIDTFWYDPGKICYKRSIWKLAASLVHCSSAGYNCANCMDTTKDTIMGAGCAGVLDAQWNAFKGLYYGYKTQLVTNLEFGQNADCDNVFHYNIGEALDIPHQISPENLYTLAMDHLAFLQAQYWFKTPRFLYMGNYTVPGLNQEASVADSMTMECDSFCIDNAAQWLSTFSNCSDYNNLVDTSVHDSIRKYLIEVCEAGCDPNHPFGASSEIPVPVTDSNVVSFSSFEDVYNYFVYQRRRVAIDYHDSLCSAYNIDYPPAYGAATTSGMAPTILMTTDSCVCANVNNAHHTFLTDSLNIGAAFLAKYPNFLTYLDITTGQTIPDSTVTDLLNLCNSQCNWLVYPITVPQQLSCATCVTCSQLATQVSYFTNQYGYVTVPDTARLHFMLTAYLNQFFGFNFSYCQYVNFIVHHCGGAAPVDKISSSPIHTILAVLGLPALRYTGQFPILVNSIPANPNQLIGIVNLSFTSNVGTLSFVNPSQAWNDLQTDIADTAVTMVAQFPNPLPNDSVNSYITHSPFTLSTGAVEWIKANASVCSGIANPVDSTMENTMPALYSSIPLVIDTAADTAGAWVEHVVDTGRITFATGSVATASYQDTTLCGVPIFPAANPYADTGDCRTQLANLAISNARLAFWNYTDSLYNAFEANYIAHCINHADSNEQFNLTHPYNEYHFTKYYYDQAGNLEKTVPPQGVHPISGYPPLTAVESYRHAEPGSHFQRPGDDYVTRYWYNTLNQMIKDSTPDGDTTHFWYDRLGRLVVSQNSKQALLDEFSYTLYDAIDRIIEVGQFTPEHFDYGIVGLSTTMNDAVARNATELATWLYYGTKAQVTHTYYDYSRFTVPHLTQSNLRKRVASVTYMDPYNSDSADYTYATHYSYDDEGNVQTLVQDIPALAGVNNRYKRIDYDYDIVSGKVNFVYYEKDSIDNFMQWYQYDADLRLTNVLTSTDSVQWDDDATYLYYNHGPLARMELGRREVQGVDYAYTINGWLKGINSSTGLMKNDMGEDGNANGWELHGMFASDVYGVVLGYYNGDYKPIKAVSTPYKPFELAYSGSNFDHADSNLFNGNIRNTTVSLRRKIYYGDTDVSMSPIGYTYTYDQLNRYVKMRAFNNYDTSTNSWQSGGAALQDYAENVSYDGNGNILNYIRHGNPTIGTPTGLTAMDSMTYSYNGHNNQLNTVADGVPKSNYTTDIDNEVSNNYLYDKNGEMTYDSSQHLKITWNVRDKIATIMNDSTHLLITFGYDAMGYRVMEKDSNTTTNICSTIWYILDAEGNILSIYKEKNDSMHWQECDIYGSSRVGVYYPDSLIYPKGYKVKADSEFTMELWEGKRQYELTNHLGNVLTTVSDKKIMLSSDTLFNDGSGRDDYRHITAYQPEIVSISDYYPYGMEEPGRNFHLSIDSNYYFGFKGMMKNNMIEGIGESYITFFRGYDPRIGRWFSMDPKTKAYESPYVAYSDNPIFYDDPRGDDPPGVGHKAPKPKKDTWGIKIRKYENKLEKKGLTKEEIDNKIVKRFNIKQQDLGSFEGDDAKTKSDATGGKFDPGYTPPETKIIDDKLDQFHTQFNGDDATFPNGDSRTANSEASGLALQLNKPDNKNVQVILYGGTSGNTSRKYGSTTALTQARADVVRDLLVKNGVDPSRITTKPGLPKEGADAGKWADQTVIIQFKRP